MAKAKNTTKKSTNTKSVVYSLVCEWRDRHGDEGVDSPRIFTTLSAAKEAMATDVTKYIDNFDGFANNEVDWDAIYSINDDYDISMTRTDVANAAKNASEFNVNVDDDGTWAHWTISQVSTED